MKARALPAHHVPEELLVEYVTGACSAGAALAFATHASLCPRCGQDIRVLEGVGGALLDQVVPEAMAPGALERLLAALDSSMPEPAPADPRASQPLLEPLGVPRVVWQHLAPESASNGWRRLVPGIACLDLRVGGSSVVARIVRLRPGLEIPLHDHDGDEFTVILAGALADDEGRFARGDISLRQAGARHVQRIETSEPCFALVINEGPLLPLTLKGKILNRIANR
jgi:putative transcriptional regulator